MVPGRDHKKLRAYHTPCLSWSLSLNREIHSFYMIISFSSRGLVRTFSWVKDSVKSCFTERQIIFWTYGTWAMENTLGNKTSKQQGIRSFGHWRNMLFKMPHATYSAILAMWMNTCSSRLYQLFISWMEQMKTRASIVHCKEIWLYLFPKKELRGLSPNFHILVTVSDLYIPTFGPPIFMQQNRHGSEEFINRSQTHECRSWNCSRAVPFLGIFVSNFRYCVLQWGFCRI